MPIPLQNNTSTAAVATPSQAPAFNFATASPTTPNFNVATKTNGINFNDINLTPTSKGGTTFNPSVASAVKAPTVPAAQNTSTPQGLSQYLTNTYSTPNGGQVTLDGTGNVSNYTPSNGYSIDTSGSIPSNALTDAPSMEQLNNTQSSYQDLVNGVANAQGYSPAYIQALQQQYAAQTQGQSLQNNSANLNANLSTGNGFTGYSQDQAQSETGIQQNLNTQQEMLNATNQLSAQQALNTQQLARTGNISAAQTQLQDSPTGVTGLNALNQYNTLQQEAPGQIGSYNPNLSPEQNQQNASQAYAQSPAYQAGFQSTYATPGGGTGIFNKLSTGALQQNSDGTLSLVSGVAVALGSANSNALSEQVSNYNNTNQSFSAANNILNTTVSYMKQEGLNQSGIPIATQIADKFGANTPQGAGVLANYQADIQELRRYYSQILGGGSSTVSSDNQATELVPDNLSPDQLATLGQGLSQNAQTAVSSIGGQINNITQSLQGSSFDNSSAASGTSVGSSWANI